ncbi:hypothetical protein E4N71_09375 [Treponema vincentii]|uniref:InlB B-repeat-containing protein n=1 Tax=Treponema vincentii TaxID=69710 RepID=UPI003D8C6112
MKKVVRNIIFSVLTLYLSIACKNYTADIDEYLSYWTTEASIAGYVFNTATQTDAEGALCVSSKDPVTITFTVRNPKNFDFKMPGESDAPADIITFPHLQNAADVSALQAGDDYVFKKISGSTLELTYTPAFLRKHEWSSGNIAPAIMLYTNDGRVFKQTITLELKVNTPPPTIKYYAVAKTSAAVPGEDAYYVLCLQVPDMDTKITGGLLHKDIAGIEINGIRYPLSIDEEQQGFVKPENDAFLDITDVVPLDEHDAADIPSGWVLYFKTEAAVKTGSAKKDYTVKLTDTNGFTSSELKASTSPNKLPKEEWKVTKGDPTGEKSGTAAEPIIIGADSDGAAVSVSSKIPNTVVHCTLTEIGQEAEPERTGIVSVTVDMPLKGKDEKTYKLEYYTDGEGFAATAPQTVYYNILLKHTVTFNLAGGNIGGKTDAITMTGTPGTPFTQPADPAKDGYNFSGWLPSLPSSPVFPKADTEYTAQWTKDGNTPYKIEHYQQNIDDDDYTLVSADTQSLKGEAEALIAVARKHYEGFTFDHQEPSAPTIAATGDTVVRVYYNRKEITLTFKLNGGIIGGKPDYVIGPGKFGKSFEPPIPTRDGYTPNGWKPALPSPPAFPAEDTIYTALWKANTYTVTFDSKGGGSIPAQKVQYGSKISKPADPTAPAGYSFQNWCTDEGCTTAWNFSSGTVKGDMTLYAKWDPAGGVSYTVKHFQQNIDDDNYPTVPSATQTLNGTTGQLTTATANAYAGFEPLPFEQKTIAGDGTTVVEVKYKRKRITVTFKLAGGNVSGSTADVPLSGKFGATFTAPVPTRQGYTFNGWLPALPSPLVFPAANAEYTAQWTPKTYTVTFKVDGGHGGSLKGTYNGADKTVNGSTEQQFESVPHNSTINFTATPDSDYEVDSWTGATQESGNDKKASLKVQDSVTVTVKFKLGVINLAGNPSDAWQRLKAEAAKSQGAHTIVIDGEIKATNSENNFGEITLGRTLTIRGKNDSAVLDANSLSRIFNVTSGKTLTLENLTLKNGKTTGSADSGGGIYVKDATLTIKDTTIQFCEAVANGGGIHLDDTATCTLGKVTIKACKALKGAGVYVKKSTLTMTECTIGGDNPSDTNRAGQQGGGIFVGEDAECTLKAGTKITTNGAFSFIEANGGGIFVDKKQSGDKGGILIIEGSEANPVTISNNTADGSGGGIFVSEDAQCILKQSVEIINNAGKTSGGYGGGVYIEGGLCTMNNVLVGECTANAGGAVYVKAGTFSISGDTRITPSGGADEQTAGQNDVYLKNGKVITVTGALTGTTPIARITPENYPTGSTAVKVLGGTDVNTEYTKFKVTDQSGSPSKKWTLNASGELEAVGGQSPAVPVSDWQTLREKVTKAHDGDVIEVTEDITYNWDSTESTIKVNKNITIKSTEGKKYTLNARGTGADGGTAGQKIKGIFEVDDDKTLTLENVILTLTEKYAVYVAENSSLTMKNVTIKDCKTQDNAAGIYFNKGKDLILENCRIKKCKGKGSQSSGGIDIQAPKGTVSIKDTPIENCEAEANGGGINLYNGNNVQCKLENVTVDNCSALRGGGIHAKAGTLTISGGLFRSNAASGSIANGGGGAIYSEGAEITITGCTIGDDDTNSGNYAVQGGGIFVNSEAKCILKAGTKISGNTAMQMGADDGNGGGIFVNRASSGTAAGILTIEGTETKHVIISGNTADYGGGLYNYGKANIKYAEIQGNSVEHNGGGMFNAGTCMMDGVTVENNKASHKDSSAGQGGGIFSDKELTLKDTTVIGNTAKRDGGAIYIDNSVFNMSGSTVINVEPSGGATGPSKNDIYLTNTVFITLTGELTATEKVARITLNSAGGYQNNREIVKGDSSFTIPLGYENKFTITDKIGSQPHWKLSYQNHVLKLRLK